MWRRSRGIREAVRLLAGLGGARLSGRPSRLSHLVTSRCPCRCETCLWRGLVDEELSAGQIEQVYRDAASVGIVINSVWGGEPLVRPDLSAILQASCEAGLLTILITNGLWFNQRFEELVPWLDGVIFSLDHPSTEHDEMRGMPGLFEAVGKAIDRLKDRSAGPRVFVNSVISRLNHDAMVDVAKWAKGASVPIYFNPIEVGLLGRPGSDKAKQSLAVGDDALSKLMRHLISLKARGYPICNSYTHLRGFIGGKRPYRCHARKVCIELRPNGDLMDCLDRFRPVANVRDVRLRDLLARPEIRRRRLRQVDCHACNNANVIDTSHIWEFQLESILSLFRVYLSPI